MSGLFIHLPGGRLVNIRCVLSSPGFAYLVWLAVWLILMGLAVVFSMSRMGIAAMLCCIATMVIAGKSSQETKRITTMGIVLVCIILGLAVYTGIDAVLSRYESLSQTAFFEKDRIPIWRDAWEMIQGQWILGKGLGIFRWVFPAYERLQPDTPAPYAHNHYLQALSEVGAIGLALLIWAFAASRRLAVQNLRQSRDAPGCGIGLAPLGALTAVALQEITDFSPYIPGVAILLAVLIGLNVRTSFEPAKSMQFRS